MGLRSIPELDVIVDEADQVVRFPQGITFRKAEPLPTPMSLTIRQLRERIRHEDGRKLTLQNLSELLRLNQSTVKAYEYGANSPNLPLRKLALLCCALQVDCFELLEACRNSAIANYDEETREHAPVPGKRRRNRIA